MASMRDAAARSYADKMGRMGLATGDGKGSKIRTAAMGEDVGTGHVGPAEDGSQGTVKAGYATGYATPEDNERTMRRKDRLDRPGYRKGGRVKGTTVNVIVAPQSKPEPPPVPPALLAAAAGAGPGGPGPMPPGPPPGPGGMPPLPGVPMGRAHGGRVSAKAPKMKAGAGGGKGRLAKIKAYGDNAKC